MKKVTKKTVAAAKKKFPSKKKASKDESAEKFFRHLIPEISAEAIERNCADCPKPRPENRSQPTFTGFECLCMTVVGILLYAVFVSDWLASL